MQPHLPVQLSKPPRFVLLGCYGERNTGDEALLAATLHLLRTHWPDAHIDVFTDSPVETQRDFGVRTLPSVRLLRIKNLLGLLKRGDLRRILATLRYCDCLIVGGGELLRTSFGLGPLLSIFDRVLLAQAMGRPVIMLGVGVGELQPGLGLHIIRHAALRSIVLVREPESVKRLAEAGIMHACAIPDLAFLLPPAEPSVALPEGTLVSFSLIAPDTRLVRRLSHIPRAVFVRQMALLADEAVALGATPVFVPFSGAAADDDRNIHRDVISAMRHSAHAVAIDQILPPAQVKGILGKMDLVVGMRLHACIFGLSQQRPVLALAYDAKVRKVMHGFQLDQTVVSLEEAEKARTILRTMWADRDHWSASIQQQLAANKLEFEQQFSAVFGRILPVSRERPQFSVIIPTYNSRDSLGRAIRSVLGQTYAPEEIIVVDDGSTDGTDEMVQRDFADDVRYYKQNNSGPAHARNTGARVCSGDWIAFLDADDEWLPEKLAKQAQYISSTPEAAFVACECTRSGPDGGSEEMPLPMPLTRATVCGCLRNQTLFLLSGVVIRKDVFSRLGGFNPTLICGEDRELWARVAVSYAMGAVHESLVRKFEHPGGVSSNPERTLRDGLIVNRYVHRVIAESSSGSGWGGRLALRRADARLYRSVAWLFAARAERGPALRAVLRSLAIWPFGSWSDTRARLGLLLRLVMSKP